jgi:oligoendopeptidase F
MHEFIASYQGEITNLSADDLASACRSCEHFLTPLQQATTYAEACLAADNSDRQAAGLLDRCEQMWQVAATGADVFEREVAAIPDSAAAHLLSSPELREYANHLTKIRAATSLYPAEEIAGLVSELDDVASWESLARQLLGRITITGDDARLSLGAALPALYDADERTRSRMRDAISAALAGEAELRATALVMLTRARLARDRACGLSDWLQAVNLDNRVSESEVRTLLDVVRGNSDVVHLHYAAKARFTGRPLTDADRYAPISVAHPPVTWPQACDIVLTAFGRLGSVPAGHARELLESGAVDVLPRPGKRRGSLTFGMPGGQALVMINFTGRVRDVLVLGHELGHAVHNRLAGAHGVLGAAVPETLAETVALFTEAVTADTFAQLMDEPSQRQAFLAQRTEEQLNTVFRQTALHDFEAWLNLTIGEGQLPGSDALNETWHAQQGALYGQAVRLSPGYQHWWSYLDNFFFAPGSRYAYAYGQLAATGLLALYHDSPLTFLPRFTEMLQAGGTRTPRESLAAMGIQSDNAAGWQLPMQALRAQADAVLRDLPSPAATR